MATQLPLPFDVAPPASGEGALIVTGSNRDAVAFVCAGQWPEGRLALAGPEGSGKSELARLWARTAGAALVDPAAPGAGPLPEPGARLVLDPAEALRPEGEEWLFHAINRLARGGGRLLLVGRAAPARWPVALADLASRLAATTTVTIGPPDDAMLPALLLRHFAARQLSPQPDVVPWLAARIERSHAAVRDVVARLDAAALGARRNLTRDFVRAALDSPAAPAT